MSLTVGGGNNNSSNSYRPPDLSYTPGDLTEPEYRLPSHQQLLDEKRDRDYGIERELPLNRLYLGPDSHNKRQFPTLAAAQARYTDQVDNIDTESSDIVVPGLAVGKDLISLPPVNITDSPPPPPHLTSLDNREQNKKMPSMHSITEKPNERCPSPVVPAYANFELAKRMHQDNLDHQPLPDCVADLAFRKAQISGGHAGLALDIDPIATGVGVKMHNAGPTHCTKLKVFRPKTTGVVPKMVTGDSFRGIGSAPTKKMGAMDLAICWDYKPANLSDEPMRSKHIDGSNDSAGPAVFTCVKTPRDGSPMELGRSAGVFTSTLGEADFFDKDIMRRKTDFGGRQIDREKDCVCDYSPPAPVRARSVSRDSSACRRTGGNGGINFGDLCSGGGGVGGGGNSRLAKQYQSTPMLSDKTYQALREKYLGPDTDSLRCDQGLRHSHNHGHGHGHGHDHGCKRDLPLRRPSRPLRQCHKVAPSHQSKCCPVSLMGQCHGGSLTLPTKAAFRTGLPRHNAAGDFVGVESGCGLSGSRVLVVPRPRNPYSKKDYDIDTLVPPFRSQGGGAGQGGYPEHWRLSSVYQHAYKPLEQRRRPLLQTVYK